MDVLKVSFISEIIVLRQNSLPHSNKPAKMFPKGTMSGKNGKSK